MVLDSANGALEVINSSEKFQIFGYSTTFGLNTAQDGQTPNAVLDNNRVFVKLWAGQSLKLTVNGMSLEPGTVLVQNHNGFTDAEGKELTEQDLQAITSGNFSAQVHQSQALSQTLTASEVSFGLADKLGDQRMAGSNGVMDLIVIDEIGTINASNTSPFGEVFSQQSLSRLTAIIASDDLLNDTISQYDRRSNNWFAAARYESILTSSASRSVRSVTGEGTAASIPFVESDIEGESAEGEIGASCSNKARNGKAYLKGYSGPRDGVAGSLDVRYTF